MHTRCVALGDRAKDLVVDRESRCLIESAGVGSGSVAGTGLGLRLGVGGGRECLALVDSKRLELEALLSLIPTSSSPGWTAVIGGVWLVVWHGGCAPIWDTKMLVAKE
jgi:hypothetical protein